MAAVGGIAFFSVKADVEPASEKFEWLERAGVDGIVLRKTGVRGEPFECVAMVDVAVGGTKTFRETVKALDGTVVSLTTGSGETYANVAVLRSKVLPPVALRMISGGVNVAEGGSGYWMEVRFQMVAS